MPLGEHLRELRSRIVKSAVAILIGTVGGWFVFDPLYAALDAPLQEIAEHQGKDVSVTFTELTSAFNLRISLAMYFALILSSPVWLYQIWAFIVPGLTRRERKYAIGFVGVSLPLFLTGVGLAWMVLPNAAEFLIEFSPENSATLLNAGGYLSFVTRLMISFGLAFVSPVLLVALNMVGVLPARTMLKGWRVATFLCFLFAAVASPTPDATTMILLALPIVALYFMAVGVATLNDRRKARKREADGFGDLDDDAASDIGTPSSADTADTEPLDR